MAKLNVPPTKSKLLELRRDLDFAREGHELLEQKRQILVLELMSKLEAARRVQEEVDQAMAAAFDVLREAALRSAPILMLCVSRPGSTRPSLCSSRRASSVGGPANVKDRCTCGA